MISFPKTKTKELTHLIKHFYYVLSNTGKKIILFNAVNF